MIKQVVVTGAWLKHKGAVLLNPALKAYEENLLNMKQTWAHSSEVSPLSWYAQQANVAPATLLKHLCPALPDGVQQCWVASPYHARLSRSNLNVLPDSMLDWSATLGQQICAMLNPLLAEDDLQLYLLGDALLLTSEHEWDVVCEDFACVSGKSLPDRAQSGKDMGRWLRLLSEIQMTLHAHPIYTPQGLQIHGLWMWGDVVGKQTLNVDVLPNVASKNMYLNSVLQHLDKQREATHIVCEAEHLAELLPQMLPNNWLLLGEEHSLALQTNRFTAALAKVKKPVWKGI